MEYTYAITAFDMGVRIDGVNLVDCGSLTLELGCTALEEYCSWTPDEEFTDCNEDLSLCDDDWGWTDEDGNGIWDKGEEFIDEKNGIWDRGEFFLNSFILPQMCTPKLDPSFIGLTTFGNFIFLINCFFLKLLILLLLSIK